MHTHGSRTTSIWVDMAPARTDVSQLLVVVSRVRVVLRFAEIIHSTTQCAEVRGVWPDSRMVGPPSGQTPPAAASRGFARLVGDLAKKPLLRSWLLLARLGYLRAEPEETVQEFEHRTMTLDVAVVQARRWVVRLQAHECLKEELQLLSPVPDHSGIPSAHQ